MVEQVIAINEEDSNMVTRLNMAHELNEETKKLWMDRVDITDLWMKAGEYLDSQPHLTTEERNKYLDTYLPKKCQMVYSMYDKSSRPCRVYCDLDELLLFCKGHVD